MLSILAWEIPWTEQPGRLQFMQSEELDTTYQLNHNHHPITQDARIKSTSPSFPRPVTIFFVGGGDFFFFFTIYDSDLILFIQKLSISFKYKICFLSTLTDTNLSIISMLCLPLSLLKNT